MEDRSEPELDDVTADRLLEGGVAPDDAPQGYQEVARTLQAAALMASEAPTQEAATAVAAFLDAIPSRRISRMKKWKIAAATLAGGLTLSTGLAAADVLPGAVQDAASSALSHVGINVPDNDDSTNVTTVEDKQDKSKANDEANDPSTEAEHPDNHGSTVSGVAHDDSTQGAEHGAAVCATASDGKCQPDDKPAASENKGQGSVNSTEGSDNSTQGSANSGEGSVHTDTTNPHRGGSSDSGSDDSVSGSGD